MLTLTLYAAVVQVSAADVCTAHAIHPVTAYQLEWSLWTRDAEVGSTTWWVRWSERMGLGMEGRLVQLGRERAAAAAVLTLGDAPSSLHQPEHGAGAARDGDCRQEGVHHRPAGAGLAAGPWSRCDAHSRQVLAGLLKQPPPAAVMRVCVSCIILNPTLHWVCSHQNCTYAMPFTHRHMSCCRSQPFLLRPVQAPAVQTACENLGAAAVQLSAEELQELETAFPHEQVCMCQCFCFSVGLGACWPSCGGASWCRRLLPDINSPLPPALR